MFYFILCLIIGLIIGFGAMYICLLPRLKNIAQYNQEMENTNLALKKENDKLVIINTDLKMKTETNKNTLDSVLNALETEKLNYSHLQHEIEINKNNFEEQKIVQQEYLNGLEDTQNKAFEMYSEKMSTQMQKLARDVDDEYVVILQEATEEFQKAINEKEQILSTLQNDLSNLRRTVEAAVAASVREEEKRTAADFYRLQLSEEDKEEIKQLRSILPFLRNKEPLNKVIYKCYYEKPYTDLVGRVVGNIKKTGIYKITNITNNMCYVGQAVKIGR